MFVIPTIATAGPFKMLNDILGLISDTCISVWPTFITISRFFNGHIRMSDIMATTAANLFSF